MKKTILASLMMITCLAFAESPIEVSKEVSPKDVAGFLSEEKVIEPKEIKPIKEGYFYMRFAAAEENLLQPNIVIPGFGIGYRRISGGGAADISIAGLANAEKKHGRFFWIAPRTSYLYYFTPDAETSLYAGAGLGWGGLNSKKKIDFVGLVPSVTLGYDFAQNSNFLGFVELIISQPAVPVYKEGSLPGPIAELSTGVGF